MGARSLGLGLGISILVLGVIGCSAGDDVEEEPSASSADELAAGATVQCGYGCPAGYVAQAPLCISTCGGCNPYGRNATQCVRANGTRAGVSSSVTCGFACPVGLRVQKRLCISTCGGCNPYGSNAVQCAR